MSSVGHDWAIAGRDADLAAIRAVLDRPGDGVVVVYGPHGVGRTRMAREIHDSLAVAGRSVAWATAVETARAIPFGALAHLVPERLATAAAERPLELLRRTDAILDPLRQADTLTIVVDDAHLLDDVSASFLHQLALRHKVSLLLTVSTGKAAPDAITALWKDGLAERFDLAPLGRETTAALLAAVLDGPLDPLSLQRIWVTTAGNPLFLLEVVASARKAGSLTLHRGLWHWDGLLTPGPRLVDLVAAALPHQHDPARPFLEVLAWGEPLVPWMAEHLAGRAVVEGVERAGLVVASNERSVGGAALRLAQPVYREVLRATMPVSRRREVCGQLAAVAVASGRVEEPGELVRVAVWQLEAGIPASQRVSFAAAAVQALREDDPRLAERLARAGLETEAADALAVLAEALEKQGRHGEVAQLLLDPPAGLPTAPAALSLTRASNLYWSGKRAPGLPPEEGPGDGEVQATEAWILFFECRLAECVEVVRGIVGRPGASPRAEVWAAMAGTAALGLSGRTGEALLVAALGAKAVDAAGRSLPWGRPELLWSRVIALVMAGRLGEARRLVDAEIGDAVGSPQLVGMSLGFQGLVARLQGDLAAAEHSLVAAVSLLDRADMYHFVRLWLAELAATLAAAGRAAEARETFDDVLARDAGTNRVFDPWVAVAGAWVSAAEGRLSDAVGQVLRAADEAHGLGQLAFEAMAAFDAARLGRPELVRDRLAALVPVTDGEVVALCSDATNSLAERDAAGLSRCADGFERLGHQLLAAEAATTAHVLLRAECAPVAAAHAAERCRQLRKRCPHAATPLLGMISDHLTLTPREREIAGLAGAGRSSPDIARALQISPRTVDNHLGKIYAKLGLTSRSQLASLFGTAAQSASGP